MSTADLEGALARFVDAERGQAGHEVTDLVRLSGGASRETFALTVRSPGPDGPGTGAVEPMVLQRSRAGSTRTMAGEADLLRAAIGAGVPVPEVVGSSDDPAVIGAPFFLMHRVDGETLARKILRDDEFATARQVLVGQCAAALAAVHALPVDAAGHLREDDQVASLVALLDSLGEPHPAFELALRWLDAHRPEPAPPRVVHGDFRLGNLIVGDDGLRAVLDWELAHLGDPIEDLGWLCVRAWRFGNDLPVAGVGTYEELIDAYAAATGTPVDPEAVRWWEVLGTLKWGVICILQTSTHLGGISRSVELAAIGRRIVENEYDVLRLLGAQDLAPPAIGPASATDPGAGYDRGPHDAPTAPQLVEAVREFLAGDVMGATTGRVQFHARVAAKVLETVERELALGPAIAVAHRDRLARLGFADDAALAAAIRAGAADDRRDEVTAAVYASVVDKLAVANPGYAVA
jgi:aminoglycoside phosphotransferase (APT) family kinase protein